MKFNITYLYFLVLCLTVLSSITECRVKRLSRRLLMKVGATRMKSIPDTAASEFVEAMFEEWYKLNKQDIQGTELKNCTDQAKDIWFTLKEGKIEEVIAELSTQCKKKYDEFAKECITDDSKKFSDAYDKCMKDKIEAAKVKKELGSCPYSEINKTMEKAQSALGVFDYINIAKKMIGVATECFNAIKQELSESDNKTTKVANKKIEKKNDKLDLNDKKAPSAWESIINGLKSAWYGWKVYKVYKNLKLAALTKAKEMGKYLAACLNAFYDSFWKKKKLKLKRRRVVRRRRRFVRRRVLF